MYDKNESLPKKYNQKQSRNGSMTSQNSVSKVEYRNFTRHEFFEEKVKMQREKVKFMIEDDPESDRKVIFKNNNSFVKVKS